MKKMLLVIMMQISVPISAYACCFPSTSQFKNTVQPTIQIKPILKYIDFYREYVHIHGVPDGWFRPDELEDDTAIEELDYLIRRLYYISWTEGLTDAEKIAFFCAQNIRTNTISFPLIESNLITLRDSYSRRFRR